MFSINLKIPLSGGKNACGSYIVASYLAGQLGPENLAFHDFQALVCNSLV